MVLLLGITIATIFALWVALININPFEHQVADTSYDVLQRYQTGEKVMSYIDHVAAQSLDQSITALAQHGGHRSPSECGSYRGAQSWYHQQKYCIPAQQDQALAFISAQHLNQNLVTIPISEVVQDSALVYTTSFSQNTLTAKTTDTLGIKSEQIKLLGPPQFSQTGLPKCDQPTSLTIENTYPDRGKIWIPKQALCGGSVDVVIMLHGHAKSIFNSQHVFTETEKLIDANLIRPVILVEPISDRRESETKKGDPWPANHYNIATHLEQIKSQLTPYKIDVASISLLGHSAANCYSGGGLRNNIEKVDLYLLGMMDPYCSNEYADPHLNKLEATNTILFVVHGNSKPTDKQAFPKIVGDKPLAIEPIQSDLFNSAYKNPNTNYYNFQIKTPPYTHSSAVGIGTKELLLQFFEPVKQLQISDSNYNCKLTNYQQNSRSVGKPNDASGRLINGVAMPDDPELPYVSQVRERQRYYATRELAQIIERTGCVMQMSGLDKIYFHDVSKQGGGELSGHKSHRSGRDIDTGFYYFPSATSTTSRNRIKALITNFKSDNPLFTKVSGGSKQQFDTHANWIFVRSLVKVAQEQGTPVQYIIVHPLIKKELIKYGQVFEQSQSQNLFEQTTAVLSEDKNNRHHDHYHIRIVCPEKDKGGANACID